MERGRSARRTNHPAMRSGLKKLLNASLYGEQKKHISMEADLSLFLIRLSIQHLRSWWSSLRCASDSLFETIFFTTI